MRQIWLELVDLYLDIPFAGGDAFTVLLVDSAYQDQDIEDEIVDALN